ncbi:MAG: DUF1361 domain-containing protein [Bacteroidota bacterium]
MKYLFRFIILQYYPLWLFTGLALLLILIRFAVTGSYFYGFLMWNLFLAYLPYVLSQTMVLNPYRKTSKLFQFGIWGLWLLLLPNAPYLITDLVHLHNSASNWMWFDLFLVFVFSVHGLLLFVLSLGDFYHMAADGPSNYWKFLPIPVICLLSGFGIYLGRFLRFNSWDALLHPNIVLRAPLADLSLPYAWLMTFAFGLFLWVCFMVFKWIQESIKSVKLKN